MLKCEDEADGPTEESHLIRDGFTVLREQILRNTTAEAATPHGKDELLDVLLQTVWVSLQRQFVFCCGGSGQTAEKV